MGWFCYPQHLLEQTNLFFNVSWKVFSMCDSSCDSSAPLSQFTLIKNAASCCLDITFSHILRFFFIPWFTCVSNLLLSSEKSKHCNWQLWKKEHQVRFQTYFATANSLEEDIKSLKSHYWPRICEAQHCRCCCSSLTISTMWTDSVTLKHQMRVCRHRKPETGHWFPHHSTTASWCQSSKMASCLWRALLEIRIWNLFSCCGIMV